MSAIIMTLCVPKWFAGPLVKGPPHCLSLPGVMFFCCVDLSLACLSPCWMTSHLRICGRVQDGSPAGRGTVAS